jgi:hypothetical protein
MRKLIFTFLIFFAYSTGIYSQNVKAYDMLQASQNFPWGTARAMGMSGAFGALGGDQTSLSINPAGIGVYRTSEFTITPSMNFNNTSSKFYGRTIDDFTEKFNLGNIGYIYSSNTNSDAGWISTNFGITYNRINNFNRSIMVQRSAANSSLLDEFVYNANDGGYKPISTLQSEDLSFPYEGLASATGLLTDQLYTPDLAWASDFSWDHTYGQFQERRVTTTGGINELGLTAGANYSHKLYLGFTIGIQWLNYEEHSNHFESDNNNTVYNLKSFRFNEHYYLDGMGYNFKMGLIYKPVDMIRLGAAVHSPTFYHFDSELYTDISADYDDAIIYNEDDGKYYSYSDAVSDSRIYKNRLRTPWKFVGSVGLQLGNFGLIDVDYEYLNYSQMRLNDAGSVDENDVVRADYKIGNNIRVGAEGKIGDIALRAGYGFYDSPYKNGKLKNNNYNTYSAGIGYRGKSFFVDFAYMFAKYSSEYTLYKWVEREEVVNSDISVYPLEEPVVANLNTELNKFVLTVGFKF